MKMKIKTLALVSSLGLLAACAAGLGINGAGLPNAGAQSAPAVVEAGYLASGAVKKPANWREWVYVGSPLTPHGLNGGAAPFPEFHNVYVEPSAFEHYERTGEWAEGTQIAKELVLVRANNNAANGSTAEVSGIGYQQGEFQGLELAVKDSSRFGSMPGGWAYFSFGHQPEPYNASAEAFPAEACNACHEASADTDFVFTQFYPVIRAAN
ncbi:MAG: cytochrome P460 family protein [Hyphomonadaceae bacterium]